MSRNGYIGTATPGGVQTLKETSLIAADVYISGGGASGGCCDWGGGGGAGGVLEATDSSTLFQKGIPYTVTVGGAGGDSYVGDLKADRGGGGAANRTAQGGNGGSGGGGGSNTNQGGGTSTQTNRFQKTFSKGVLSLEDITKKSEVTGYGNSGSGWQPDQRGGSGGGAAAPAGGDGGSGKSNAWDGSSQSYSGGGGGAGRYGGQGNGASGGGRGGAYGQSGQSAGVNRGSGGGGQGYSGAYAGSGGSGIVYIRSLSPISTTGAQSSGTNAGYYWARWTGSGTVTFG